MKSRPTGWVLVVGSASALGSTSMRVPSGLMMRRQAVRADAVMAVAFEEFALLLNADQARDALREVVRARG
ncbi:hypothetical protein [Streptomyces sp. NBC_00690]|uniref:hypothetical protein n=1 Tax=Streptomyces sp. NBC_00690 TaxID=2975808 RepID=UPI002E2A6322|nr:hypothetical protein [Streptomyces sp. NBC_00690]